jgi:hypothetical protein
MGELQVDLAGLRSSLAAAVAAPVSRAAPQPPQSPMTQQQQPAVPSPTTQQQSPQLSDSASSGGRSGAPAAGARDTEPSHEGSRRASNASAVKLLLSTREEEALRRHLLRVGGAGRYFNSKPPPSTPSAESDASGLHHYGQHSHSEPAIVSHHHHLHHGGHADAPTGSSESVGRHSYVGAEDDDSQSRYHDALRATGHKLTERYVPASALPGSAGHHRLSRRSVHNQSGTNFSAAESTSSASLYNRHVHHSYGSLPMRSAATETYIQHHSPPHMGGSGSEYGEAGVRGEQQQIDSASDRLVDTDLHGTAE